MLHRFTTLRLKQVFFPVLTHNLLSFCFCDAFHFDGRVTHLFYVIYKMGMCVKFQGIQFSETFLTAMFNRLLLCITDRSNPTLHDIHSFPEVSVSSSRPLTVSPTSVQ